MDRTRLKVLSYWNLNYYMNDNELEEAELKVLSYWNLNSIKCRYSSSFVHLKYYHIGI